jgi:hypothetical protein
MVEHAVTRLSRSRRWLAPLALAVGAFVMLFDGLRLVFFNGRLTLIQVLPASDLACDARLEAPCVSRTPGKRDPRS